MASASLNNEAKESFITKIVNLNPDAYMGCFDKKYVFVENGVQIAVTLTCPKVPYGGNSGDSAFVEVTAPPTIEFTADEKTNVEKLMAALGI